MNDAPKSRAQRPAGLALAVRLAQLGWRVVLHERNAELRMFGAGIWLWENGLRSLKVLGAYDAALARAKTIKEWRICDGKGRVLMSRPMTPDDRLLLPPRADLYQALIDRAYALGVDIRTSSHVASATPDGILILQSGEERKADLVVGADGAFSRIREAILCTRWMDFGIEAGIRMMIDTTARATGEIATEYWNGPWRLLYYPCTSGENYIILSAPCWTRGPQAPGGSRSLEIPVSACARPDLPLLEPAHGGTALSMFAATNGRRAALPSLEMRHTPCRRTWAKPQTWHSATCSRSRRPLPKPMTFRRHWRAGSASSGR